MFQCTKDAKEMHVLSCITTKHTLYCDYLSVQHFHIIIYVVSSYCYIITLTLSSHCYTIMSTQSSFLRYYTSIQL